MRVPPDLTTATLYKYMVLRLLFPLHSWHCYVQTESNTVNREIFTALKVGEFAFCQLAVDTIPRLLQKFNG
jgi:NADH:ubiquinone oxidoreductase subunit 4 (subunit M)